MTLILVPVWLWVPAIRRLRARLFGEHRRARALASVLFVLTLPCLALSGSLTLYRAAQHLPCRSDYASNTTAPFLSSTLLAVYQQAFGASKLAVVRARDGATQWTQQNLAPSPQNSSPNAYNPDISSKEQIGVISFFSADQKLSEQQVAQLGNTGRYTGPLDVEKLTETYLIHHPYMVTTAQNSLYLFDTVQAEENTWVYQDLTIASIDTHTGNLQWKREFRVESYTNPTPIRFSRFGTHLYLHAGPTLFALDALNGTTRWQSKIGYTLGADTIEAENVVYVSGDEMSNGRAALYALNPTNGGRIWECSNFGFGSQFSALGLSHGVLFANSQKVFPHYIDFAPQYSEPANALLALSSQDGSVYWRNTSSDRSTKTMST